MFELVLVAHAGLGEGGVASGQEMMGSIGCLLVFGRGWVSRGGRDEVEKRRSRGRRRNEGLGGDGSDEGWAKEDREGSHAFEVTASSRVGAGSTRSTG
jgi:hypothetical protein